MTGIPFATPATDSARRARQSRRSRVRVGADAAAARGVSRTRRSTSGARSTRRPSPRWSRTSATSSPPIRSGRCRRICAGPDAALPAQRGRGAPAALRCRGAERGAVAHRRRRRRRREIPMRIGLARHRNAPFLTHVLPAQDPHKPVFASKARLLAARSGSTDRANHYRLDPARAVGRRSLARRRAAGAVRRRFIRSPATATAAFRSRVDELASDARARGMPALWIGTPEELDELREAHPDARGLYVDHARRRIARERPLPRSRSRRCFVGHDSGPLHVAAAFGVPVVGVFAPGQPERTFPQGAGPWRMITGRRRRASRRRRCFTRSTQLVVLPRR